MPEQDREVAIETLVESVRERYICNNLYYIFSGVNFSLGLGEAFGHKTLGGKHELLPKCFTP
ncbi:hypothetical protein, partial [Microcoleus anatoxicus]